MWPGLETCRRKKIVCSWDINDRLDNSTKELEDSIQQNYTTKRKTQQEQLEETLFEKSIMGVRKKEWKKQKNDSNFIFQ